MKMLLRLSLGLLILILPACSPASSPGLVPVSLGSSGPHTWLDAPLNKMHLPLAAYEIVFHATGDSAIAQVELQINDQRVAIPSESNEGNNLVTVKYLWSPSASGEYVLRARSQDLGGAWSEEAVVTVWVGDLTPTATNAPVVTLSPTATNTLVVTLSPTATISATPTMTSTPTATGTPPPAGMTFIHGISANQFYYGRCNPTSIDFEVTVSGGDVDSVVLFIKLNDQSGSGSTGWMSYNAMKPVGEGTYTITVVSSNIAGFNSYSTAWMIYQFVATKNNLPVGRSESFGDVVLTACNVSPLVPAPELPPIRIIRPTNTPQIIK